ncbi:MAG: PASTA domain-containing protein [bacterium]|nr:PASTA domain-containing protein [bacterium]
MKFRETFKKFFKSKVGKALLTIILTGIFLLVYSIVAIVFADRIILEKYVGSRKTTEVPYLSGLKVEECAMILNEKKLKWNVVGSGKYVWKTEPPAGMLVKEGRIIHLYLSDNPRGVTP